MEMIKKFCNDMKLDKIGKLTFVDSIQAIITDKTGASMNIMYIHDGFATNRNDIILYQNGKKIKHFRFQNNEWILI